MKRRSFIGSLAALSGLAVAAPHLRSAASALRATTPEPKSSVKTLLHQIPIEDVSSLNDITQEWEISRWIGELPSGFLALCEADLQWKIFSDAHRGGDWVRGRMVFLKNEYTPPLRFYSPDSSPIEPFIRIAATMGVEYVTHPDWESAPYQAALYWDSGNPLYRLHRGNHLIATKFEPKGARFYATISRRA